MKPNHTCFLNRTLASAIVLSSMFVAGALRAQTNDADAAAAAKAAEADLVKKSLNPVAAMISVPLQNNWDFGIGPNNATKYTLNIQPVIPVSISEDYNLIVRTIVPINELSPRLQRGQAARRPRRHHPKPLSLAQGTVA